MTQTRQPVEARFRNELNPPLGRDPESIQVYICVGGHEEVPGTGVYVPTQALAGTCVGFVHVVQIPAGVPMRTEDIKPVTSDAMVPYITGRNFQRNDEVVVLEQPSNGNQVQVLGIRSSNCGFANHARHSPHYFILMPSGGHVL